MLLIVYDPSTSRSVTSHLTTIAITIKSTSTRKGVNVGGSRGGASATDAAVALSQLPVLGHFHDGLRIAFAIIVIFANFAALVGLVFYFRTACTREYGVLPNESGDSVPPALADLENHEGVTIISRSLVYFQANDTYLPTRRGG